MDQDAVGQQASLCAGACKTARSSLLRDTTGQQHSAVQRVAQQMLRTSPSAHLQLAGTARPSQRRPSEVRPVLGDTPATPAMVHSLIRGHPHLGHGAGGGTAGALQRHGALNQQQLLICRAARGKPAAFFKRRMKPRGSKRWILAPRKCQGTALAQCSNCRHPRSEPELLENTHKGRRGCLHRSPASGPRRFAAHPGPAGCLAAAGKHGRLP
jgi:hypothetical protein